MITEQQQRAAVAARDPHYDGRFVYAVVTTGVYCRPSCGARRARAENLRFFHDPAEAAAAGYRPCKRCRPDEPLPRLDELIAVARHIEANRDQTMTLATLAQRFGWSPSRLQKAFKAAFGVTPKAYQDGARLQDFKGALQAGREVTAAIQDAGFGSTSRVYGAPARNIGMTPGAYRAGGAGESIAYANRDTPFGSLTMAATARGVCFAEFGEDAEALLARLAAEFPTASLYPSPAGDSVALSLWVDALVRHLENAGPRPELPLDLRGTAFQLLVWRFLLSLPDDGVISYGELAAAIGRPKAVRAVASACGANRIAVLVPCHRVLRGDGGLGGYRWGEARKRALLDGERRRRGATSQTR